MLIARACIGGRVEYGEITDGQFFVLDGDVYTKSWRSGISDSLDNVTLLAPSEPEHVYIVLSGFMPQDGSPLPPGTTPNFTAKIASNPAGQDAIIQRPSFIDSSLVIECELGVVIGKMLVRATPEEARDAIFGFTCSNDVTIWQFIEPARDLLRGKSYERFVNFGPWIRTDLTEDDVAAGLTLVGRVNGEERQRGNSSLLKFPPSVTISAISQHVTLRPGDVVSLGTPSWPPEVVPGDDAEVELEGIGVLRCHVR